MEKIHRSFEAFDPGNKRFLLIAGVFSKAGNAILKKYNLQGKNEKDTCLAAGRLNYYICDDKAHTVQTTKLLSI